VLQKQFQRDDLILCDVLTCRDSALRKLQLMQCSPYPGKREAALQTSTAESSCSTTERRHVTNQHVTTANRSPEAIRVEIVQSAYNFLAERLQEEQNEAIAVMKKLLSAHCLADFVESGLAICKNSFLEKKEISQMLHANSGTIYPACLICQQTVIQDVHCLSVCEKCCPCRLAWSELF